MFQQPIAVIGASGQLAQALVSAARARGLPIAAAGRPEADLISSKSLVAFLDRLRPWIVINAAAYTAVDKAETDVAAAFALNAEGPANLAELCALRGVAMMHVSTDFVFDGLKRAPYREEDASTPLSIYGRSKAAGEDAVRSLLAEHIILRTAWVYGPYGNNFLKTMLRLGGERDAVRVVSDQTGTPTAAKDIANTLLDIAAALARSGASAPWGTYHYVASGETTWHGFAAEIFAAAKDAGLKTPRLEAITTSEYPLPAKRPAYSVLDTDKIRNAFSIVPPPWQRGVAETVRQLMRERVY